MASNRQIAVAAWPAPALAKLAAKPQRRVLWLPAGQAGLVALWLGGLALLLGAGFYSARMTWTPGEPAGGAAAVVEPVEQDPVARFSESRVGHLLFMQPDGRNCRRVLFDNATGSQQDVGAADCSPREGAEPGAASAHRVDAIRNSFKR